MKKRRWKHWAPLAALLVVFVLLAGVMGSGGRDAEWYAEYVRRNEAALLQIARGELQPEQSIRARYILAWGRVEHVYAGAGQSRFYVKNKLGEGHVCLVYAPDGDVPTCLDFYDNWVPAREDGGIRRWTGGMGGRAYINLHDLGKGFYLEQAYLPT